MPVVKEEEVNAVDDGSDDDVINIGELSEDEGETGETADWLKEQLLEIEGSTRSVLEEVGGWGGKVYDESIYGQGGGVEADKENKAEIDEESHGEDNRENANLVVRESADFGGKSVRVFEGGRKVSRAAHCAGRRVIHRAAHCAGRRVIHRAAHCAGRRVIHRAVHFAYLCLHMHVSR